MRLIPIESIKIPANRQRTVFEPEALAKLQASIEQTGLLHPIVVRSVGSDLFLVAGERRLKSLINIHMLGGAATFASQPIPAGQIPCSLIGELSPLAAEEAELEENLRRENLTWQEEAEAIARLHRLRIAQAEERSASESELVQHTIADTARELTGKSEGSYQQGVRKALLVEKVLGDKEIAGAKSLDDAFKILQKRETTRQNIELAKSIGKDFTTDKHTLLQGDCCELLKDPKFLGAFDVIATDPPYGMNAQAFGDGAGRMTNIEHRYDDSPEAFKALMTKWIPLSFAVTKPQAHLYLFCDLEHFFWLRQELEAVGWDVFRTPLILHKVNSGRVPRPEHGPRRQYELVLYALKGGKRVNQILPDVFVAEADPSTSHGAQKPVGAWKNLLSRSVVAGNTVLDCFGGSGGLITAGHDAKCSVTYIEQSQDYFAIAYKRLQELRSFDEEAPF